MTDNEIIKKVLDGDRNTYGILVERYQSMIFRTCLGYVHNKEDANDLTQEVFIRAFQSLKSFKGEAAFSTWIYRIAVNASLNKVRKSPKLGPRPFESLFASFSDDSISHPDPSNGNPEHNLIRAEERESVLKALDSLPENQRTALVLSKYDDLPQKKIAEIMHTSEGAVEALLHRAKTNLQKKLLRYRKR